MSAPTLELRRATRTFGEIVAVRDLDVRFEPGRIHALVGENGAGKSTALKMVAGHLRASTGQVLVDGQPLRPATPQEAIGRGIGMVHQHFMLIDHFTALENLVLGSEPTRSLGRLDLEQARHKARQMGAEAGLEVDLERPAGELAVGERQRLEILRVLYRGARALLLDEPTAVLSPVEVGQLYRTLRQLGAGGATIAVVTHRLDEVVRYCDEVSVMRRGSLTSQEIIRPPDAPGGDDREPALLGDAAERRLRDRLTRAIMGGEPPAEAQPPALAAELEPALKVSNAAVEAGRGAAAHGARRALDGLSLAVRPGEIVGVAGVEGNGQRELARALAGLEPLAEGTIELDGAPLFAASEGAGWAPPAGPRAGWAAVQLARSRGQVVVHEDRHHDELLLDATIADNLVLGDLGHIDESARMTKRFERFDVYPPDPTRLGGELSGGNQQKVVMGRALDRKLRVLVLAQPTRGVDVGTARIIQHAISEVAAGGVAVVMISADLNELRSLCHRITVLRRGRIAAELPPSASDEEIGRAMLGLEEAP